MNRNFDLEYLHTLTLLMEKTMLWSAVLSLRHISGSITDITVSSSHYVWEEGSERGRGLEAGGCLGNSSRLCWRMGNGRAIWSSKVGRQRAPFLSRACRKMPIAAKNGSHAHSWQPAATMKRKTWLERRHHQSCCSALNSCEHVLVNILPLEAPITAGDGTPSSPFWEEAAGGRPPCPPRLLRWWRAFTYKVMAKLSLMLYFNALT